MRRIRNLSMTPIGGRAQSERVLWSEKQMGGSGSHTFAVVAISPNALNVSYRSRSSTFSSKLPTKRFAPTSSCFLSDEACNTVSTKTTYLQNPHTKRTLFTRIGLPHSLIWFMILHAYSASSSVRNSQKPYPWCVMDTRSFGKCTFTWKHQT